MVKELSENSEDYDGWISSGWIQEYIHVDEFPAAVRLHRRYAFRYLKITVMDNSLKYKLVVCHAECLAESSADLIQIPGHLPAEEPLLEKIYEVSLKTNG